MKAIEYASIIVKLALKHPDADIIWYDPEHHRYSSVGIETPVCGKYSSGSFLSDLDGLELKLKDINAVCIN